MLQNEFGNVFNIGDEKSTTIGQIEGTTTSWGDSDVTGQTTGNVVLIKKTPTQLSFICDKYVLKTKSAARYNSALEGAYNNHVTGGASAILPDCYQYLVNTTTKRSYNGSSTTVIGLVVSPTRSVVLGNDGYSYFSSNSRRKISDGAYRLPDSETGANYFVDSDGSVKNYNNVTAAVYSGGTAIFTIA